MNEPLNPNDARDLARAIWASGSVRFSRHARQRMADRNVSEQDIGNTILGGHCKPGKGIGFEGGSWRYTLETARIAVVVAFRSETEMVIVSCWRF